MKKDRSVFLLKFNRFSAETSAEIEKLKYDPNAIWRYEIMSGGLMWKDEFSDNLFRVMSDLEGAFLRAFWGYRGSVIIKQELQQYHFVYEKMLELFPNWPAFREERWSPEWEKIILQKKREIRKDCINEAKKIKKEIKEEEEKEKENKINL